MSQGKSFADALRTRTFEPDGPNYIKVSENEHIKALMEAEQHLNTIMQDINRIITNPLQELYSAK